MKKLTSDELYRVAHKMLTTAEMALNADLDRVEATGKLVDETNEARLLTVRVMLEQAVNLRIVEAAERYDKRSRGDWLKISKLLAEAQLRGEQVAFPGMEKSKLPTTH